MKLLLEQLIVLRLVLVCEGGEKLRLVLLLLLSAHELPKLEVTQF